MKEPQTLKAIRKALAEVDKTGEAIAGLHSDVALADADLVAAGKRRAGEVLGEEVEPVEPLDVDAQTSRLAIKELEEKQEAQKQPVREAVEAFLVEQLQRAEAYPVARQEKVNSLLAEAAELWFAPPALGAEEPMLIYLMTDKVRVASEAAGGLGPSDAVDHSPTVATLKGGLEVRLQEVRMPEADPVAAAEQILGRADEGELYLF